MGIASPIVLTDQKVKPDKYYYEYSQLDYLVLMFTMAMLYSIERKIIVKLFCHNQIRQERSYGEHCSMNA